MHSSEPFESQAVNDPSRQASADESWRAEVASRVNRYRAGRKRSGEEEDAPALDFGPAVEAQGFDPRRPRSSAAPSQFAPQGITPQAAEPRSPARAVGNAFDTNYYRRLNAESRAQLPERTAGAAAIASVPQFESEIEAESDAALSDEPCGIQPERPDEESGGDAALDLELHPAVAGDSVLDRYAISAPDPEPPIAVPAAQEAPPAQGNLIVFRRPLLEPPLLPQPSRDELAEPMNNRPRILEVPEDIMPAVQGSLFPEIRLDVDEPETSSNCEPKFEIPLLVAPVSERLRASLTDLGVVLAAGALFAGMAWRALPEIPHSKPFWMVLAAVTLLFWTVYQHLFLLYAGRTLGMSLRGIRLSTFDGRAPDWEQRGRRARFMVVSFAPVTLGFLWALVDEDRLCWHDRISQTFPTAE
jgi:uncharacterized RDD family membrane protein YckC